MIIIILYPFGFWVCTVVGWGPFTLIFPLSMDESSGWCICACDVTFLHFHLSCFDYSFFIDLGTMDEVHADLVKCSTKFDYGEFNLLYILSPTGETSLEWWMKPVTTVFWAWWNQF